MRLVGAFLDDTEVTDKGSARRFLKEAPEMAKAFETALYKLGTLLQKSAAKTGKCKALEEAYAAVWNAHNGTDLGGSMGDPIRKILHEK